MCGNQDSFLAGDMAQVVKYLPSKNEALSSNSSTAKKRKSLLNVNGNT
jgi:hypothetical protein